VDLAPSAQPRTIRQPREVVSKPVSGPQDDADSDLWSMLGSLFEVLGSVVELFGRFGAD
jgi:hypothetical protein